MMTPVSLPPTARPAPPVRPRFVAVFAWLACALVAGLALWNSVYQAGLGQHPVTLAGNWLWNLNAVVFAAVAALIVSQQPRNTIGWLLLVFPLAMMVTAPLDAAYAGQLATATRVSGGLWWYVWFQGWSWWLLVGPVFLIAQLFPTGRPLSPRWRVGLWLVALWFAFFIFLGTFAPVFEFEDRPPIPNPLSWPPLAALDFIGPVFVFVVIGIAALSVAAIFVRYRRAGAVVREQIKWLAYGLGVFLVIYVVGGFTATDAAGPTWFEVALPLSIMLVPVAIGLAILRYRLFDIDVIIRRTLVYSAASAVLALAYFGSVLVLQNLFQAVTGERQNALVTVLSTLLIAALFGPVRARLQQAVDRRFYRQKYNAAATLAEFGARARDVVALEQLSDELTRAVDETMQPAHVGLWVRPAIEHKP